MNPVGLVRRRWSWMLLALVVALTATAWFVFSMKPRYVASARLLVTTQQIPEDFVRPTVREIARWVRHG